VIIALTTLSTGACTSSPADGSQQTVDDRIDHDRAGYANERNGDARMVGAAGACAIPRS
jgi:hypothetical protein